MLKRILLMEVALVAVAAAADLPIHEVILYKHGVGYFERAGELKAGETARLDFKAADMNDVLKSLTIVDRSGGTIAGVRYDASEPLDKRLQEFPFQVDKEASLPTLLDQMKGARLELRLGSDTITGTIVSARHQSAAGQVPERDSVVLLTDSGEIRVFDLGAASSVKLTDPKLQTLMRDFLTVLSGARSKDRRSVYIDAATTGTRQLAASYMTPSAVWKSSYRLIFGAQGQPMLEGWAIIDNTSGDDWSNVKLSVVSGRPISFITQLYEPRYVNRPTAELAENRAVAPVVFQGAVGGGGGGGNAPGPALPAAKALNGRQFEAGLRNQLSSAESVSVDAIQQSSFAAEADTRDLGELFEYSFATPVTVKQGESAMLPFLQQKVNTRKLLIYMESFGLHPMNAAEITNSTGKTLDGGPITVYDSDAYAGEALVETLKAGDKRLISYGVDLGTRVSTAWNSSTANVREVHFARGVLTTRNSVQETKTYSIKNVDPGRKTIIIEHAQRPGYKLLDPAKPSETTADAYRFEVNVGGNATESFAVREERVYDQSFGVSNMTPDVISSWVQNKALSDAGRRQLEQVLAKKREIAANDSDLNQAQSDLTNTNTDEDRQRRNIDSLRNVAGQQDLVQQYARQLAAAEVKLAGLRDRQTELQRKKATLNGELNGLIEKMEF
jgi:hypothetical protein